MIVSKGHYTFVRGGLGKIELEHSTEDIPLYGEDGVTKVGTATIKTTQPLQLEIQLDKDVRLLSNYLSIVPQNYSIIRDVISHIFTFKFTSNYHEFKPFTLSKKY